MRYKLIIDCLIEAENNSKVDNKSTEIVKKLIKDWDIVVKRIKIVKLKEKK